MKRYRSRSAEVLLQSINDDADSLGITRRHLSYLTLELGRAEASMQPDSVAYSQKLIELCGRSAAHPSSRSDPRASAPTPPGRGWWD